MRKQLINNACSTVLALSMLASFAISANAADGFHQVDGSAVLGGAIGGGAGAAVGSAIGGRNGALLGGAVGAAAGVAIATPQPRVIVHDWDRDDHDNGWHHGDAKHHHRHHHDDD